jgi:two-component system, OmpR family, KDP operon response regulator KdpE
MADLHTEFLKLPRSEVLLVEDDPEMPAVLAALFEGDNLHVVSARDAAAALVKAGELPFDLILLDLGLPDLDGQAVILRVRHEATTPIIVVSARGREEDRVAALDAGADDYLTKPFGLTELHARMRAVLRRAAGPAADTEGCMKLGPVTMDVPHHSVTVGETAVELTPREFELLKVLLSHSGRVVTAGRLLRAVWGSAYSEEGHYLHVYVSRLRRKLAAADQTGAAGKLIVAEPGVGYRIVAE